jgi:hypothetical protein
MAGGVYSMGLENILKNFKIFFFCGVPVKVMAGTFVRWTGVLFVAFRGE